jgi:hypothetical protein
MNVFLTVFTVFFDFATLQTATALGKLGHPDGELNLTRAAAKHGVIQMVRRPYLSSLHNSTLNHLNRYPPLHHVPLTKLWMLRPLAKFSSSSCM